MKTRNFILCNADIYSDSMLLVSITQV